MRILIIILIAFLVPSLLYGQDYELQEYRDDLNNVIRYYKDVKYGEKLDAVLESKKLTSHHFSDSVKTEKSISYVVRVIKNKSEEIIEITVERFDGFYIGMLHYELKIITRENQYEIESSKYLFMEI
tara:strand:+ start:109 stop:489 length:381 start_codon:yes stop_codon:yes gene_type:complete